MLTAVASYLDTMANDGEWSLRIEDLDTPRVVPHASDDIRRILESHALHWCGPVVRQSERTASYEDALDRLASAGLTFRCSCSRSQLANSPVYPGTCRGRSLTEVDEARPEVTGHAVRVIAPSELVAFADRIQGQFSQDLRKDVGDFVVRRRDGVVAYQLAVVIDDAEHGIDQIVRGADLLDNTPRQLFLYDALRLPRPTYAHVPVLTDRAGNKLSKQTHAAALDQRTPSANLILILDLLGQNPESRLTHESPAAILVWAAHHWRTHAIPNVTHLTDFVALC